MSKQLNLITENIIPAPLHLEMEQSYLEYAMSVIVGRALPDVRDGLKPVHRRILYAMHELGLTPDRPFRKCARVVGDVLGKYHPHGDQAVYDALVRMVQEFSSRYPLLQGHGNFGSVDNDPPAAMRYTETRLAPLGQEGILGEIGESIVNFTNNFDNSQQEPTVLPAQLPFLLLNGCTGIAVGMATSIPPHNLGEIVDGLIALIDHPNLSDEKLLEIIPAPDFPTGGEILYSDSIVDAYTKGKGSIVMRGVANIEEVPTAKGKRTKTAIVVTELPYQVNKAGWIEKTADLVNNGRLDGIADIRDESDRNGIRVVIELKREANPGVILHHLYQHTELMCKFGAIMLALVNGQPKQLTLRELLQEFLTFREVTLTRQYNNELEIATGRSHVLEGLLIALENLDEVVEILRNAADGSTAKITLQENLELTEEQADALLAMPMRRLTGMEQQKLVDEFNQLSTQIEELQELLGDRKQLLKSLKKELRNLKKKHGDDRRTRIIHENGEAESEIDIDQEIEEEEAEVKPKKRKKKDETSQEKTLQPLVPLEAALPPAEEVYLEISQKGYIKKLTAKQGEKNYIKNFQQGELSIETADDFTIDHIFTNTDQNLIVLTKTGKAYPVKVRDIPMVNGRSRDQRGVPIVTLLPAGATKELGDANLQALIASQLVIPDEAEMDLIMLTESGKIKRLSALELMDITTRGITVIKLKEDDQLRYINWGQIDQQVVLGTTGGRLLRIEMDDEQLPIMGRSAQGTTATRLRKEEAIVGCVTVTEESSLLLVSAKGYCKRIEASMLRTAQRGSIGQNALQFNSQSDVLAGLATDTVENLAYIFTSQGRLGKIPIDTLNIDGSEGAGKRLFKLTAGETIVKVWSAI